MNQFKSPASSHHEKNQPSSWTSKDYEQDNERNKL